MANQDEIVTEDNSECSNRSNQRGETPNQSSAQREPRRQQGSPNLLALATAGWRNHVVIERPLRRQSRSEDLVGMAGQSGGTRETDAVRGGESGGRQQGETRASREGEGSDSREKQSDGGSANHTESSRGGSNGSTGQMRNNASGGPTIREGEFSFNDVFA
jgi:hypothetical protein